MKTSIKIISSVFAIALLFCSCSTDDVTHDLPVVSTPIAITSFSPTSAHSGDLVTITGANFTTTGNAVTINGMVATVQSVTATTINILVPNNAGNGAIVVTNTNGTATSTISFTYIPTSAASFKASDWASLKLVPLGGSNPNSIQTIDDSFITSQYLINGDSYIFYKIGNEFSGGHYQSGNAGYITTGALSYTIFQDISVGKIILYRQSGMPTLSQNVSFRYILNPSNSNYILNSTMTYAQICATLGISQ